MEKRTSVRANPNAPSPILFGSVAEKAALEARNALLQFDEVLRLVDASGGTLNLTPEVVASLQRIAIQDIYACAGVLRDGDIFISNSPHTPPPPDQLSWLVQDMCDYANKSVAKSPIHTAAFLLWRLNWIHPFSGGNGRTSRAISYLALCVRLGFKLPGRLTIPEQITQNRQPYYDALDEADAHWKAGTLDLSRMEELLASMLARQLVDIHAAATGSP